MAQVRPIDGVTLTFVGAGYQTISTSGLGSFNTYSLAISNTGDNDVYVHDADSVQTVNGRRIPAGAVATYGDVDPDDMPKIWAAGATTVYVAFDLIKSED